MNRHRFLVSDESINSHGFKVLTAGIDTSNFEKNPIMLYMHERPNVIGRWENLTKENGKLYADAVFDVESEKGKEVARQVEQGFLRGASMGILELERSGDVVTKSEVVEISIVDIGSNSNALKLYKDTPEIIRLSMNEANASQKLVKILGLSLSSNSTEIIEAVEHLQKDKKELLDKLNNLEKNIKQEQSKEADRMVRLAVKNRILPENLANIQKMAFENDFNKAKEDLQKLLDEDMAQKIQNLRKDKVRDFVELMKSNKSKQIGNKPRTEWTLQDYRRFAPEELQENPDLYNELIKQEYKQN
jgi:caudovirus prohead protease